ncbi:MAG: hypothetical protein JO225_07740 [Candidatus Eremiobacteraeota bacterium]|nr:hypothetical protein [Candidatus Eremiobacteraeota bacterium]MBV8643795.1 hypothetical protein [Candidatus Eremiobacteraeota bacterium]
MIVGCDHAHVRSVAARGETRSVFECEVVRDRSLGVPFDEERVDVLQFLNAVRIVSDVDMQLVSVNENRAVPDSMSGQVHQKRAFRRKHRHAGMTPGEQIANLAIDPRARILAAEKLRMRRVVQRRTAAG